MYLINLPNNVIFNILHIVRAKARSELSKIVTRSPSETEGKNY